MKERQPTCGQYMALFILVGGCRGWLEIERQVLCVPYQVEDASVGHIWLFNSVHIIMGFSFSLATCSSKELPTAKIYPQVSSLPELV